MGLKIMSETAAGSFCCAIALFYLSTISARAWEVAAFNHMLPAYCFAGNEVPDPEAIGGYARNGNTPKRIDTDDSSLREGVYLQVVGPAKEPFAGRFGGLELRVVNNGPERLILPASDSRLQLFQEGRTEDGEWKPLEFFPRSWCGNSHHNVYLEPGYYFSFITPKYEGPRKTRLRFVLFTEQTQENPGQIYSQEFDGGIDPAQFRHAGEPLE